jgi:hypothetical protein
MEAEQQTLERRVNFATIELKLAEEYEAQLSSPVPSAGMQLRNAIVNGFRSAAERLLGIVLFFAESGFFGSRFCSSPRGRCGAATSAFTHRKVQSELERFPFAAKHLESPDRRTCAPGRWPSVTQTRITILLFGPRRYRISRI